jgi:peptidoglycan/xylan/chitin deacetylase (PgdA/CDA1 family)
MIRAAAAIVGVGAVVQAAPGLTAITPMRRMSFPGLSGQGDLGHVALTFDDGPDPNSTPRFLEFLAAERIQATFFLLGSQLRCAPGLGAELVAAGHEVGVHGFEHRCLLTRTPAGTHRDLATSRDLVADLIGVQPRWYRPPYGVLTTAGLLAAKRLGMRTVLWTTWGRDWERGATPASIASAVARPLQPGGTILLHDSDCTSAPGSWSRTLAALPAVVEEVRRRGLTLGPLGAHGVVN